MSSMSPARAREFWADTFRLLDLSAAKRNDDALALAIQIAERFPEQPAEASYLLACAYNRAGKNELALRTLETALDRGNCWHNSLLTWSPSLRPLRYLHRFHAILARSKAIMDNLEAGTRVGVTFFPPNPGQTATAPPLFLPLHGGADIPGEHDGYWAAAADLGLLVGIALSSQRRSSDTFWWGGPPKPFDHERSERDVKTAYNEAVATFDFDVAQVLLGGFSQGAVLAVTLALQNQPFPIQGVACVGRVLRSRTAGHLRGPASRGHRARASDLLRLFHLL